MHVLRHIASGLASPVMLALLLGLVAIMLRSAGRKQAAKLLGISATVIAWAGSTQLIGNTLMGALERQYVPLAADSAAPVSHIVVLGSSYEPRNGVPITGALDYDGLARVVEGVRLMRRGGATQLVLSGGAPEGNVACAVGYRDLARQLGVPDAATIVLDAPLDTYSEAIEVSALLGSAPFILVTSAYHMPRAMRQMQAVGAMPIAAPTAQRVNDAATWSWRRLLPTSDGLRNTERALHEYLGLTALDMGLH